MEEMTRPVGRTWQWQWPWARWARPQSGFSRETQLLTSQCAGQRKKRTQCRPSQGTRWDSQTAWWGACSAAGWTAGFSAAEDAAAATGASKPGDTSQISVEGWCPCPSAGCPFGPQHASHIHCDASNINPETLHMSAALSVLIPSCSEGAGWAAGAPRWLAAAWRFAGCGLRRISMGLPLVPLRTRIRWRVRVP